jgi:hypothetical protein
MFSVRRISNPKKINGWDYKFHPAEEVPLILPKVGFSILDSPRIPQTN